MYDTEWERALAAKLGRRPTRQEARDEQRRIDDSFQRSWAAYEATWTDEERARVARATASDDRWGRLRMLAVILVLVLALVAAISAHETVARSWELSPFWAWVLVGACSLALVLLLWILAFTVRVVWATRGLPLVLALLTWGAFALGWAPVGWVLVIADGLFVGWLVIGFAAAALEDAVRA